MADAPSDVPVVEAGAESDFGPPHSHMVSDTLQMWILLPAALVIFFFAGENLDPWFIFSVVYIPTLTCPCCSPGWVSKYPRPVDHVRV